MKGTAFSELSARRRLRSVVAVMASISAVAASGAVSAGPAAADTVIGIAQPVTGASELFGIACEDATTCIAVGRDVSFGEARSVVVTSGTPSEAQPVPGGATLRGVACPTATTCMAVGVNGFGELGVLVVITNGTPGGTKGATGMTDLWAVACSNATTCFGVGDAEAVGDSDPGAGVVPITAGSPGVATPVADATTLRGITCPSATTCLAVGRNSSGQGVVVPITGGAPGVATVVPDTTVLNGIACPDATTCEVVGSNGSQGVVVVLTGGVPAAAQVIPDTTFLSGIACADSVSCEAVGKSDLDTGAVVPVTNGTVGATQLSSSGDVLNGVACPSPATCYAVSSFLAGVVTLSIVSSFSVDDVTVTEGNSGSTAATFTITRSAPTTYPVSVDWSTADGSAVAPGDYTAVSPTTVNFAAGETTKTVAVSVIGDTAVEANDGFSLNLTNPLGTGAAIGDGTGVGRITNDDTASFSVNDVTVIEGNAGTTVATFTIARSGATGGPASVVWRTLDVHAIAATGDYVAVPSTTLSFGPGELTKTVSVTVNGDTTVEPTEDFYVRLSSPTGATIADATGLGTITNDDVASSLAVNDVTVTEGDTGTTSATFTVTRSGDTNAPAQVDFETVAGTATAGSDYVVSSGSLLFEPGDPTETVSVPVHGDTAVEANETFTLRLSNPQGATIADATGLGRITNDDAASLAIGDATVAEGNTGTTVATFTVTRTGAAGGAASVVWSTATGTATAGGDYVAVSPTTLSFGPGETSKTVSVTIIGDTAIEANETFVVKLSSPIGASLGDSSGLGRITNDD